MTFDHYSVTDEKLIDFVMGLLPQDEADQIDYMSGIDQEVACQIEMLKKVLGDNLSEQIASHANSSHLHTSYYNSNPSLDLSPVSISVNTLDSQMVSSSLACREQNNSSLPVSCEVRVSMDGIAVNDYSMLPLIAQSTISQSDNNKPAEGSQCNQQGDIEVKMGDCIIPGQVIAGKYLVRELIGEGGMGQVYLADHLVDYRRRVAIKVVRHTLYSQDIIARFNIECQALANFNHQNIVTFYDKFTLCDGRPCYVMEMINGMDIVRYCDTNRLTISQRVSLFIQVCRGVQHCHQKGVVHRDLKPSNVIVRICDDVPTPTIIDFGLAKALHQPITDDILHTKFGTFVGTWQYTAPEQAVLNNLDIDTRADIYSLGVILYELLTGSPLLDKSRITKATMDEILRIIREEEPPKPSTKIQSSGQLPSIAALRNSEPLQLGRNVRGELDWIVMRALEKDRNRRYSTANDLACDLENYLSGKVVSVSPPSITYRLSKYLYINRIRSICIALTITIVIALSTIIAFDHSSIKQMRSVNARTSELLVLIAQTLSDGHVTSYDERQLALLAETVLEQLKSESLRPVDEARVRRLVATALLISGDRDGAIINAQRVIDIYSDIYGSDHESVTSMRHELAALLANKHEY